MSWELEIIATGDLLPIEDTVVSISSTPASVVNLPKMFNRPRLCDGTPEQNIESLKLIVLEVEKTNQGMFNDSWCVNADNSWSKNKETQQEFEKWYPLLNHCTKLHLPFSDYTSFCGYKVRTDWIQKLATRLYLYYKAGYTIKFTW